MRYVQKHDEEAVCHGENDVDNSATEETALLCLLERPFSFQFYFSRLSHLAENPKILPLGLPPASAGSCSPDAERTYFAGLLRKKDSRGGHRQERVVCPRKDVRWNVNGVPVS